MPQDTGIFRGVQRNRERLKRRGGFLADLMVESYTETLHRLRPQIDGLYQDAWQRGFDTGDNPLDDLQNLTQGEAYRLLRGELVREQVINEITKYAKTADSEVYKSALEEIEIGKTDTERLILAQIPKGAREGFLDSMWDTINPDLNETAVFMFQYDGSGLRRRLEDDLGTFVAQDVADTMTQSLILGHGPAKAARAIRDSFGRGMTASLTFARTAQLNAYRETQRQNFAANPEVVKGWIWGATLDDRTCIACIANHGKKFYTDALLNDHHNGRCVMLPIVDLPGIGTQDIETGESWFKRQPEDKQRKIMGPGRLDLWKQKKFHFDDLRQQYEDPVYGHMIRQQSLKNLKAQKWSDPSIDESEIVGRLDKQKKIDFRDKVAGKKPSKTTGTGPGPGGRTPTPPPPPVPVVDPNDPYPEIANLSYYDLWTQDDPNTGARYTRDERDRLIKQFNKRADDEVEKLRAKGLDTTKGTAVRQKMQKTATKSRANVDKLERERDEAIADSDKTWGDYLDLKERLLADGMDSRDLFDVPEFKQAQKGFMEAAERSAVAKTRYGEANEKHQARVRRSMWVPSKDRRYSGIDVVHDKEIDKMARAEVKDTGSDYYGVKSYKKRINDGATFVQRMTHVENSGHNAFVRNLPAKDRPKLAYKTRKHVDQNGNVDFRDSASTSENTHNTTNRVDTATAVHEVVHLIESDIFNQGGHEGTWKARQAFYNDRTAGDSFERFVDAPETRNHNYKPDEKFKRDKWFEAVGSGYPGKPYTYRQFGYETSSEIMTMGVQTLYEDPEGFADRDPEYFDFVVSWLRGAFS